MTNPNHTAGNLSADNAINLQQLLADHGGEIPGTALPELYQKSFGAPLYPKGTKLKVALQSWPLSDVCDIDLRPCLNGPPLMAVLSKNSSPSPADVSAEVVAVAAQLGWTQVVPASDAVAPVCVSCHNEHKDTPKNDFALGDVMGGVVIRIPVD